MAHHPRGSMHLLSLRPTGSDRLALESRPFPFARMPPVHCDGALYLWRLSLDLWCVTLLSNAPRPRPRSAREVDANAGDPHVCISGKECFLFTYMYVFSASSRFYSAVLALFCDMCTNANPAVTAFRQRLDGLNLFITIHQLPSETANRLRSYYHQQRSAGLRDDAQRSLPLLSVPLQIEALLLVHSHWMDGASFLGKVEDAVKIQMAVAMGTIVFAPSEVAPTRCFYVLSRGTVVFGGRFLSRNSWWGDDVLFSNPRWISPFSARALTYADAKTLTRAALIEILSQHPESYRALRMKGLWIALRRAVIAFANERRSAMRSASPDGQQADSSASINLGGTLFDGVNSALDSRLTGTQKRAAQISLQINSRSLHGGEETDCTGEPLNAPRTTSDENGHGDAVLAALERLSEAVSKLQDGQAKLQTGQDELRRSIASAATLTRKPPAERHESRASRRCSASRSTTDLSSPAAHFAATKPRPFP